MPVSENEINDFAVIDLLKEVDPQIRKGIAAQCSWRRYASGEQIIDRQSEATDIFFVVEGTVRVVNYSFSGREVTFDDLAVGSHFGELAAIDGEPRSASVMAITQCHIASLTQERFLNFLEQHPGVALKLMQGLTRVIRAATVRIMDLSTLAANNRVQADLLRLARNLMDDDGRALISPIPVHADIASRVSTTRETVARVLNDLARKGIVVREKNALVINNLDTLREMVEDVRGD